MDGGKTDILPELPTINEIFNLSKSNKLTAYAKLFQSNSSEQIKRFLKGSIQDLTANFKDEVKENIAINILLQAVFFSKRNDFTVLEIIVFICVLKNVAQLCAETTESKSEIYEKFKKLVMSFVVYRPPHSIDLLTHDKAEKMIKYVVQTFFRHFAMYKYVFTPKTMEVEVFV